MQCPKCAGEKSVKNGMVRGLQRHLCKECGCNFTQSHKHGYPAKDKILAVLLHLSGMSMNAIAPIIGVSTQSVMRWIRAHGEAVAMPQVPSHAVEVEIDEMHHFLKRKMTSSGFGRCWIIAHENFWGGSVAIVIGRRGKELSKNFKVL